MKTRIYYAASCIALFFSAAAILNAQDGAGLYTFLCASCHDGGNERAPNRDALRAMSPERVLTAMESGAMVSMASGRSMAERRALAQFVTGKTFAQELRMTPPQEAMCARTPGEFAN